MPVLITYNFNSNSGNNSYGYSIENSPADFIREVNEYDDGIYIIVNVIDITDEQAQEWDGALAGM